jgi:hypothetical protein
MVKQSTSLRGRGECTCWLLPKLRGMHMTKDWFGISNVAIFEHGRFASWHFMSAKRRILKKREGNLQLKAFLHKLSQAPSSKGPLCLQFSDDTSLMIGAPGVKSVFSLLFSLEKDRNRHDVLSREVAALDIELDPLRRRINKLEVEEKAYNQGGDSSVIAPTLSNMSKQQMRASVLKDLRESAGQITDRYRVREEEMEHIMMRAAAMSPLKSCLIEYNSTCELGAQKVYRSSYRRGTKEQEQSSPVRTDDVYFQLEESVPPSILAAMPMGQQQQQQQQQQQKKKQGKPTRREQMKQAASGEIGWEWHASAFPLDSVYTPSTRGAYDKEEAHKWQAVQKSGLYKLVPADDNSEVKSTLWIARGDQHGLLISQPRISARDTSARRAPVPEPGNLTARKNRDSSSTKGGRGGRGGRGERGGRGGRGGAPSKRVSTPPPAARLPVPYMVQCRLKTALEELVHHLFMEHDIAVQYLECEFVEKHRDRGWEGMAAGAGGRGERPIAGMQTDGVTTDGSGGSGGGGGDSEGGALLILSAVCAVDFVDLSGHDRSPTMPSVSFTQSSSAPGLGVDTSRSRSQASGADTVPVSRSNSTSSSNSRAAAAGSKTVAFSPVKGRPQRATAGKANVASRTISSLSQSQSESRQNSGQSRQVQFSPVKQKQTQRRSQYRRAPEPSPEEFELNLLLTQMRVTASERHLPNAKKVPLAGRGLWQ